MTIDTERRATAIVIGGGPGGLMAAEVLAAAGLAVTVHEHMAAPARKFVLAGRGGLNLTHGEPIDAFVERYGPRRDRIGPAVLAFGPTDLREWCAGLGEPTFVGSSGRVFPESFRAVPLLRSWLARLASLGVEIRTRERWLGFGSSADGSVDPSTSMFELRATGEVAAARGDVTVLALGGASWPRLGSDGRWSEIVRRIGVGVAPFEPANCGVVIGWSAPFRERFEGAPLKNVAVRVRSDRSSSKPVRGELVVTSDGLEGGPVYAQAAEIREAIAAGGCSLLIDLAPDLAVASVEQRLSGRRRKESRSTWVRRALSLDPASVALLSDRMRRDGADEPQVVARLVKGLPLAVAGASGIDRAISSAGGVVFDALDEHFMVRELPGVFVAGEMLDWEAPTGGYLLQATFSTAVAAARGALAWLDDSGGIRPESVDDRETVDDGETVWHFDPTFLRSNWTCIWGRGCHGIGRTRDAAAGLGCCSMGAELDGEDEALNLAALAATIGPELFEHHALAAAGGVFSDGPRTNTRVVDGACIFLNRPGFVGGPGCALHLAALAAGERPLEWKPSVCWQLPIKVDWSLRPDGREDAVVRGWSRRDWGADGPDMAWCCTEGDEAYVGDRPVVDALDDELREIAGEAVVVELRRRWGRPG